MHRAALDAEHLAGQTFIEVHVAGWSEGRDRAEAYVLRSPSAFLSADERPYVWRSLEEEEGIFHTHHETMRESWQLHRVGAQEGVDWNAETFDPIRHGIPLMEMQRRRPADAKTGVGIAGKHLIGGALWLTIVDREGVRQGVIHEWPDHVGEPIRPTPLDEAKLPKVPPVDWCSTFERFERFMAEGLIDPVTLAVDVTEVNRRLAAAKPAAASGSTPPSRAKLNLDQRRIAKAQARKKGPAHV